MYKAILASMVLAASLFSIGCADSSRSSSKTLEKQEAQKKAQTKFVGLWGMASEHKPEDGSYNLELANTNYAIFSISSTYEVTLISRGFYNKDSAQEHSLTLGKLAFLNATEATLVYNKKAIEKFLETSPEKPTPEELKSIYKNPPTYKLVKGKLVIVTPSKDKKYETEHGPLSQEKFALLRVEAEAAKSYIDKNALTIRASLAGNKYELVETRYEMTKKDGSTSSFSTKAEDIKDEESFSNGDIDINVKRVIFSKDGKSAQVNEKHEMALELHAEKKLSGMILALVGAAKENETGGTSSTWFLHGLVSTTEEGFTVTNTWGNKESRTESTDIYKRVK